MATSDALAKKIQRIIEQVELAKDRRWLSGQLKDAHEPSLEQRIFEVFETLPIGLDTSRLRAFAKDCADRRNEISHFGGERQKGSYSDFVTDLEYKSGALSILYHALLLYEIGVDANLLRNHIYEGWLSRRAKYLFVKAGLSEDEARISDAP